MMADNLLSDIAKWHVPNSMNPVVQHCWYRSLPLDMP
jgi:hypothetical protein